MDCYSIKKDPEGMSRFVKQKILTNPPIMDPEELIISFAKSDAYNQALKFLLDNGIDPNNRERVPSIIGNSDFCIDQSAGGIERMFKNLKKYLLSGLSSSGNVPILWAIANAENENIKTLLDNPLTDLTLDDNGAYRRNTPLHLAIAKGNIKKEFVTQIVKKLAGNSKGLNKKNNCGLTPLHLAILRGDYELVDLLIESGADPNIEAITPHGKTSSLGLLGLDKKTVNKMLKDTAIEIIEKDSETSEANKSKIKSKLRMSSN